MTASALLVCLTLLFYSGEESLRAIRAMSFLTALEAGRPRAGLEEWKGQDADPRLAPFERVVASLEVVAGTPEGAQLQDDLRESVLQQFASPERLTTLSRRVFWGQVSAAACALALLWLSWPRRLSAPSPSEEGPRAAVTRKILRSMQNLVVIVSAQGTIQDVNQVACSVLGYQREELLGREIELILATPRLADGPSGSYKNLETSYRTRSGQELPVLLSCSVVDGEKGEVRSLVLSAFDLSERQQLWKAEGRLEALLAAPMVGIARLDEQGRVVEVNRTLETMLGIPLSGPLGQWLHVDDQPSWNALLQELFESSRESFQLEVRYSTPEGPRWGNTLVSLERGEPLAALCLIQDVTAARTAQAELSEAREKLRDLLERLVYAQEEERRVVARDLHDGLLQCVIAADLHLRAFARSVESGQDKNLQHCGERLREAVAEGRRLIQNLRPAVLEQFGLERALGQLLEELHDRLGWEVEFEYAARAGLPPAIETAVYRIVGEALHNAQKHSQTARVQVAVNEDAKCVRVNVRDFGVGLPTPPPRGVGLESMRERAELLGGTMTAAPADPGTLVTAVLPAHRSGRSERL